MPRVPRTLDAFPHPDSVLVGPPNVNVLPQFRSRGPHPSCHPRQCRSGTEAGVGTGPTVRPEVGLGRTKGGVSSAEGDVPDTVDHGVARVGRPRGRDDDAVGGPVAEGPASAVSALRVSLDGVARADGEGGHGVLDGVAVEGPLGVRVGVATRGWGLRPGVLRPTKGWVRASGGPFWVYVRVCHGGKWTRQRPCGSRGRPRVSSVRPDTR